MSKSGPPRIKGHLAYHLLIMRGFKLDSSDSDLRGFVDKHGLFDLVAEMNKGTPPRTYVNGKNTLTSCLDTNTGNLRENSIAS